MNYFISSYSSFFIKILFSGRLKPYKSIPSIKLYLSYVYSSFFFYFQRLIADFYLSTYTVEVTIYDIKD